jgi:Dr1-associated corepressor
VAMFAEASMELADRNVAKALELFMISLVTKAAAEAKDRSSKRVTAAHLKQAVAKDQTLDFLQEIMEKVPDPTEKRGGRGTSEDVAEPSTKRKPAPRRRNKTDSDEDDR